MKIVNEWDPIGLIASHAPIDEYSFEIEEIKKYLYNNHNITVEKLAEEIDKIFKHYFDDIYTSDINQCFKVAEKILE